MSPISAKVTMLSASGGLPPMRRKKMEPSTGTPAPKNTRLWPLKMTPWSSRTEPYWMTSSWMPEVTSGSRAARTPWRCRVPPTCHRRSRSGACPTRCRAQSRCRHPRCRSPTACRSPEGRWPPLRLSRPHLASSRGSRPRTPCHRRGRSLGSASICASAVPPPRTSQALWESAVRVRPGAPGQPVHLQHLMAPAAATAAPPSWR
jgi:hypothetical protein